MAKRRKRRRYSGTPEQHQARAENTIREIRRLQGVVRSKMKGTPDCVHLSNLFRAIGQQEGVYLSNKSDGTGRGRFPAGVTSSTSSLHDKFVKKCVLHPRNRR